MSNLTRKEQYLSKIAENDTVVPSPLTRDEIYLKELDETSYSFSGLNMATSYSASTLNDYPTSA